MRASKSLRKRFARWLQDLLFLSLFLEAPMAGVVTKYLTQPADGQQEEQGSGEDELSFESVIHKMPINLTGFLVKFLKLECGKESKRKTLRSVHVTPH
jgi:hypothetical protein